MSKQKVRTQPDLSLNSPLHQEALLHDQNFDSWQYNVADHLKGKTTEEIKKHLQETAFPFAVCMENWRGDFNFSSLVRNANAFNFKEVFYIGDRKVDRRGMTGVYNYTDVNFLPTIDDLIGLKSKYIFVGVDNVPGAIPIKSYEAIPNTLFIFGSEGTGLTPELQKMCDKIIYIEQHGSVRSLNAAVASGIIMHHVIQGMYL